MPVYYTLQEKKKNIDEHIIQWQNEDVKWYIIV